MKRSIVLLVTVLSLLGTSALPTQAWGNCVRFHRVRFGETLAIIARFYGTTFPFLASINGLSNPNFIFAGQLLCVAIYTPPPTPARQPTTYVVQPGDWLALIARRFGVSLSDLIRVNPLMNPNFIFPGEVLIIPGSGGYPINAPQQPTPQPYVAPSNGGMMNPQQPYVPPPPSIGRNPPPPNATPEL